MTMDGGIYIAHPSDPWDQWEVLLPPGDTKFLRKVLYAARRTGDMTEEEDEKARKWILSTKAAEFEHRFMSLGSQYRALATGVPGDFASGNVECTLRFVVKESADAEVKDAQLKRIVTIEEIDEFAGGHEQLAVAVLQEMTEEIRENQ